MKIELKGITIKDLSDDFIDNNENGVVGYGGKLDIRPPYQREFIYKDKQRDAVISTITKKFPLNVMYWAVRDDSTFEVIDGQQRTISICQYINGDFAYQNRYFHNLLQDEKKKILDYPLMVYVCSGDESEKLEWFKTINIAGEKLTDQELRNAVYTGSWVSDAKRYFSKTGCVAFNIGSDYLNGSAIRQEYLETIVDWISEGKIENYMAQHQKDANALALWTYFHDVIDWIEATFTNKRKKFMKGIAWGVLYNKYKDEIYDAKAIEEETARLIADDAVEKKNGIYAYILTRDESYLGIRIFSDNIKQKVYEKQTIEAEKKEISNCPLCAVGNNTNKNKIWSLAEMDADHVSAWSKGGATDIKNCEMLCKTHNKAKGNK